MKKKVICFGSRGNEVIYKNLELENINNDFYFSITTDEYKNETQYIYQEINNICYEIGKFFDIKTIDELKTALSDYEYIGAEGFKKLINDKIQYNNYINLIDIELCKHIEDFSLMEKCIAYRIDWKQRQIEKDRKKSDERKEKERQEEEKEQRKIKQQEEDAEKSILNKKELYNNNIEDTTIILRLLKKFDIKVPLKTQGWINKALAKIVFKNDGNISYYYYKSSKNSTVFEEYLITLEEKIKEKYFKQYN